MASTPVNSFEQYEGKNAGEVFLYPVIKILETESLGIKVMEDIQSKLYIYFNTLLDKVTKERTGCGSEVTGAGTAITRRAITVKDMEIFFSECADVFSQTIHEEAKKKGVEIGDLTGTEIETLLRNTTDPTIYRDMLRIAFFGDTSLVGDDDYNQVDGWFKKITAGVAATTIANVSISAMATAADSHEALSDVYDNQPLEMQSVDDKDKIYLVDRNIYNKYKKYLSTLGTDELSHVNMVNGQKALAFQGIPVLPMDIWTKYFNLDFPSDLGNGRVILLVKDETLVLGVDASSDSTTVDFWYEKKDDLNYTRVRYKMGPDLKHHIYLSVAGFGAASS